MQGRQRGPAQTQHIIKCCCLRFQDERHGHPDEACQGCEALAEDWQVFCQQPAARDIQPCRGSFRSQETGQRGEYHVP